LLEVDPLVGNIEEAFLWRLHKGSSANFPVLLEHKEDLACLFSLQVVFAEYSMLNELQVGLVQKLQKPGFDELFSHYFRLQILLSSVLGD